MCRAQAVSARAVASLQHLVERGGRAAQRGLHAPPVAVPGTTCAASISTRDAVAAPARKKRRRTRPTATTSSPTSSSATHAGGSHATTGHRHRGFRRRAGRDLQQHERAPDGSTRTSAGLEQTPRTIARLTDMTSPPVRLRSSDAREASEEVRRSVRGRAVTATSGARTRRRQPQRGEALGDVGERRVAACAPARTARAPAGSRPRVRRDRRARTRAAGGAAGRASRRRPRRSSVAIASLQAARVGERAGEHDATLGHERRRRRRLPRAPPTAPRRGRSAAAPAQQSISTGCCSTEPVRSANASELLRGGRVVARAGTGRARAARAPRRRRDRRRAADAACAPRRAPGPRRTPRRPGRAGPGRDLALRPAIRRELVGRLGGTPAPARDGARRRLLRGLRRLAGSRFALAGGAAVPLTVRSTGALRGRVRAAASSLRRTVFAGRVLDAAAGRARRRRGSCGRSASARAERRGRAASLRRSRPLRGSGRPDRSLRRERSRCAAVVAPARPPSRRCRPSPRPRLPAGRRLSARPGSRRVPGCPGGRDCRSGYCCRAHRDGRGRRYAACRPCAPAAASGRELRSSRPRSARPRSSGPGRTRPAAGDRSRSPRLRPAGRLLLVVVVTTAGRALGHGVSILSEGGAVRRTWARTRRCPPLAGRASSRKEPGGDLLSQENDLQVPSARAGLTAVFGMGTGVSPPPWPPGICQFSGEPENSIASTRHLSQLKGAIKPSAD